MSRTALRLLVVPALAAGCVLLLSSCGDVITPGRTASRKLPAYEPPLARNDFPTVRTTAYTHTEADHLQYSNRTALGGTLRAASEGTRSASAKRGSLESFLTPRKTKVTRWVKTKHGRKKVIATVVVRPTIGSAAADWSRFPAGTTFRLLSTGQIYQVEDYGWALAGRNTIDLYMANRGAMNRWGVRTEPIQILRWGDPQASLSRLESHQGYKHIHRMVLELQGNHETAAALE